MASARRTRKWSAKVMRTSDALDLEPERVRAAFVFGIALGIGHDNPHAPHSACGLRARRERPSSRTATEKRDELAAFHAEHGDFLPCHDAGFTAGSASRRTVGKSLGPT